MQNQTKQHTLWLLAAASAPLAHFCGCGWFAALLAAAVVLPLNLLPKSWEGMSGPLALLQLLWLGGVAGWLLQNSAAYWPSDNDLVVPLTLLTLAAVTPKSASPRIGAVLAFCVVLLALPVAISGAAHLESAWVRWSAAPWPAALSLVLLFPALPAAGAAKKGRQSIQMGLLTILLALLVQGTISPRVAGAVDDPFYQTARTLGYLEPVAAVGMTLGWYAMAAFLLKSAAMIAESGSIGNRTAYVLPTGTAIAALLLKWQPGIRLWAVLSTILWVLIPFLTKIKKSKKHEKSP